MLRTRGNEQGQRRCAECWSPSSTTYTHIPQRAAAEIPARMCVPLAPTANAPRRCRSQGGASANTSADTYAPGASFRYSPDRRFLLSCCHSAAESPREKPAHLSPPQNPPPKKARTPKTYNLGQNRTVRAHVYVIVIRWGELGVAGFVDEHSAHAFREIGFPPKL